MDGYEMTIADLRHTELTAAQPGRSAIIGESGSFDFTKEGTSSHYAGCSVIVDNANIPYIEKRVRRNATLYSMAKR